MEKDDIRDTHNTHRAQLNLIEQPRPRGTDLDETSLLMMRAEARMAR